MRSRQLLAAVVSAVLSAVLAACAGGSAPGLPDKDAAPQLLLPARTGAVPIVVLVPGGSWTSADPTGLVPLARALSEAGYVAMTATYRTSATDDYFPTPVEDVLCAAGLAAAQAKDAGRGGGPVVLVGHSAGAPLALLAALRPEEFRGGCKEPPVTPAGAVGLAGAYDVSALGDVAVALFGGTRQARPAAWKDGDVAQWVAQRPAMPVLLVHGTEDDVVPPSATQQLAAKLTGAGHPVELRLIPGAGHQEIYTVDVVGQVLLDWLRLRVAPAR